MARRWVLRVLGVTNNAEASSRSVLGAGSSRRIVSSLSVNGSISPSCRVRIASARCSSASQVVTSGPGSAQCRTIPRASPSIAPGSMWAASAAAAEPGVPGVPGGGQIVPTAAAVSSAAASSTRPAPRRPSSTAAVAARRASVQSAHFRPRRALARAGNMATKCESLSVWPTADSASSTREPASARSSRFTASSARHPSA